MSGGGERAGLYLHVPFCARICPYCDFAVRTGSAARRERFVAALEREVRVHAGEGWSLDTLYLGGGTPSSLAGEQLGRILAAARATFAGASDARVYLEANPEDVSAGTARAWRALGVGTLSLGAQSLDPKALAFLGRSHTAEQVGTALRCAREAGFPTVSIDLIYGLPFDTPARWRSDLAAAIALRPDHLSCYQLSMPDGTLLGKRLARGEVGELSEPERARLFRLTHEVLADAGFEGYEVSNFARGVEHRSYHNRKYWRHVPYLGLGPAAHSFAGRRRFWNQRKLDGWQDAVEAGQSPVAGSEELSDADLALEEVMLGLRTVDGVDLPGFAARHGFDLAERNRQRIARLAADGLLRIEADALYPTLAGLAVADSLARILDCAPEPACVAAAAAPTIRWLNDPRPSSDTPLGRIP